MPSRDIPSPLMKTSRFALALLCASLVSPAIAAPAALAAGTQAGEPLPDYRIDETRYFQNAAAERDDRRQLTAEAQALSAAAPDRPEALEAYLQHAETLLARCDRHRAYLHLLASRDIGDHAAREAYEEIGRAWDQVTLTTRNALRDLGEPAFAKAAAARPSLQRYGYVLAQSQRGLEHKLAPQQVLLVDELADPAASSYWTLYQQTRRATVFGTIHTPAGERNVDTDAGTLATDADRQIRRQAWEKHWDGYTSQGRIYAELLLSVVRLIDRVARLEHYPDGPTGAYAARALDRAQVDESLAAVRRHLDLFKRVQRLRDSAIADAYGMPEVQPWDRDLPQPGFTPPRFDWSRVREILPQALAPLGTDYVRRFEALLDPSMRRLDIAPVAGHRVSDGFSVNAPGLPSGLFLSTYDGSLDNLRAIIHEGGHAMQGQVISDQGVSPLYTQGPKWLNEAVAICNELLLHDYLQAHASDPRAKAYYLQALVDDMAFQIFTSAEETSLEQAIYDGVAAGRIQRAEDLDALTFGIVSQYEASAAPAPQLAHIWMTKRLMYQDPLYLVNYLYAGVLATKMYAQIKHDPAAFSARYESFLRSGFNAPPETLLRQLLGEDMDIKAWVEDDMLVLQERTDELARLHEQLKLRHIQSSR
jgi:oligoendopeptidase F